MYDLIFFNVNEDDEVYQTSSSFDIAAGLLQEFPNDTIVVTTKGSPAQKDYASRMGS